MLCKQYCKLVLAIPAHYETKQQQVTQDLLQLHRPVGVGEAGMASASSLFNHQIIL